MFISGLLPLLEGVALGAHIHRIPGMEGVIHIEVVMVTGHRHDEMGPIGFEELHQAFRIPVFSLEERYKVFIAKLGRMAVAFGMEVREILGHFQLHARFAGIGAVHPPAIVRAIVRTVFIGPRRSPPVGPNPNLSIHKPLGDLIVLSHRLPGRLDWGRNQSSSP